MKTLAVDYKMNLCFTEAVTDHYFVLRCIPTARGCQTVTSRSLEVTPQVPLFTYRDTFGNFVYRGQCYAPHTEFAFRVNAQVLVHNAEGSREPCQPFYKYNTPLTFCNDSMKNFLLASVKGTAFEGGVENRKFDRTEMRDFASFLCSLVNKRIVYTSGSTTVKTTAAEAFSMQKGVCQDYAHLFVSLAREAGLAARYVCGMSIGEGATHAWAEFFVPDEDYMTYDGQTIQGTWFGLDPTRNKFVDDTYVILSVGRDFTDCQVDRGVFCGSVGQKQTVLVKTSEIDMPQNFGEFSGHSVSSMADLAGQQ